MRFDPERARLGGGGRGRFRAARAGRTLKAVRRLRRGALARRDSGSRAARWGGSSSWRRAGGAEDAAQGDRLTRAIERFEGTWGKRAGVLPSPQAPVFPQGAVQAPPAAAQRVRR